MTRFRSASCDGEYCYCGAPADAKVEETIFHDDPHPVRHPLTAYVCRLHFDRIMGRVDDEPNMDNYEGPRGGEAAAELAHRQAEAQKLK